MTGEHGKNTLTAPSDILCGDPGDPDSLWKMAWECQERPAGTFWLVSKGKKGYLLVPTDRVRGIECPALISGPLARNNYWQTAVERADYWFKKPRWGTVGLGVNAAGSRSHDQLHIHMSAVRQGVRAELDKARQAGTVAGDLKSWPNRLTTVTGSDEEKNPPQPDPRSYRVVHVDSFQLYNLFIALYDSVVTPTHEEMGEQTMTVIGAGSGPADGYYILNSRKDLPHTAPAPKGIGYCDSILVCK
nr:hypothetical protein StreXyl84_01410 [Streptomyces sp. Xyl84]